VKNGTGRYFLSAAIIGVVVAVAGAATFLAWEADTPFLAPFTTLRLATVSGDDNAREVLSALQQQIRSEHARIQLSAIETPSIWTAAQAVKEQTADLATVRGDDPTAAEGRAIFILRNLTLAILVPAGAVDSIGKLQGKKIGILTNDIDPMIKVVLDFYGLSEKQVVRLDPKGLPAALQHKQVAAVAVVGPNGAGPIADAVDAIRGATKRPPRFLDITEAAAIAGRHAVYQEAEISAGTFGGSPVMPSEKVATLSTNMLLVSRISLSNHAAGELTRLLLAAKSRILANRPQAGQLAAPSADKDALLPAHPGTVAYLNGEQSDLLDRSTNLILLCSMLTGFVGWLATGLNAMRNRRGGHELKCRLGRLPVLLEKASQSGQPGAIEKELSQLSDWLLQNFLANEISAKDFHNAEARLAHVAALIQKRRRAASLRQLECFFEQRQSSAAAVPAR
jgi:uncharacterized protein